MADLLHMLLAVGLAGLIGALWVPRVPGVAERAPGGRERGGEALWEKHGSA